MTAHKQIEQALSDVTETCKDFVKRNIHNLIKEGFIKLSPEQGVMISSAVDAAVDEAKGRSKAVFDVTVAKALENKRS